MTDQVIPTETESYDSVRATAAALRLYLAGDEENALKIATQAHPVVSVHLMLGLTAGLMAQHPADPFRMLDALISEAEFARITSAMQEDE